jgi:hypothetical protein
MGPPGQACVLKILRPNAETISSNTNIHDLRVRHTLTATPTSPTDHATLPRTASKGLVPGEPPTIGCLQTAMIGCCHASNIPLLWASLTRIPVTTPAAVSNAVKLTANTNIEIQINTGKKPECPRRSIQTDKAASGNRGI